MKKYLLILTIFFCSEIYAQSFPWAKSVDGNNNNFDDGLAVCLDSSSNVFIAGAFGSPMLSFGTFSLVNSSNLSYHDGFLAKYTSNGSFLWAVNSVGSLREIVNSVSCDLNGNSFITGYFTGSSLSFGTYSVSNAGAYTAKLDPNGNTLWLKNIVGAAGNSACADAFGNVFVTGHYQTTIIIGTYTFTNSGFYDNYVAKYDPNGNVIWAKKIGGSGAEEAFSVTVDNSNNVLLTGRYTSSSLVIGTTTLSNPSGAFDVFVAKFDNSGNFLWAKNAGGSNHDGAYSISADAIGNSYITGYISSPMATFDTYTITNSGFQNVFVAKYDPSGNVLWAKSALGNGYDDGFSVHTHSGGVYVSGGFNSNSINYGSNIFNRPIGGIDPMFIFNLDVNGNLICGNVLTSGGGDLNGITADKFGSAYICSEFQDSTFFVGVNMLTLTGKQNVFVAKYSCLTTNIDVIGSKEYNNLNVFPNPNSGNFEFELKKEISNGEIILINSIGQEIFRGKVVKGLNSIEVKEIAKGLYNCLIIESQQLRNSFKVLVE